jgi:hypothetical protein
MNIVEALAFFNIVPERDIDSRIRARAPDGRVTQEILDGVRDEILELCKQEFRKRAKELHPDTGGDLEKMQLLNSMAAEVKKLEIRGQPPPQQMMVVRVFHGGGMFTSTATGSSTSTFTNTGYGW